MGLRDPWSKKKIRAGRHTDCRTHLILSLSRTINFEQEELFGGATMQLGKKWVSRELLHISVVGRTNGDYLDHGMDLATEK